jgi:NitT/TauT family transport system substrate-binding protein
MEGTVLCGKNLLKDYSDAPDLAVILGQFRGRRIGVPGKGSIHDVILKASLQKTGLSADVTVVNFAWADQVLEAVVHDEVAAAIGTPALAAAVKYYAGGKVLYPPAKLWPHNPSCGILAGRVLLETQRDLLGGFLRAHEDATAFLRNRTGEAAKIIAGYLGFADEELVLEALRISPKYCAQLTDEYIASTMEFVKTQRALGYIDRDVTAAEIFDASLIREVHGPGEHYSDVV